MPTGTGDARAGRRTRRKTLIMPRRCVRTVEISAAEPREEDLMSRIAIIVVATSLCLTWNTVSVLITPAVGAQTPGEQLDFDYVFVGPSPSVPGSEAILVLDTTRQVLRFTSHDPILGDVLVESPAVQSWLVVSGSPERLVFQATEGGVLLRGDVLFSPYNRAVLDVVKGAKRVRYLLKPGCACLCVFPSFFGRTVADSPVHAEPATAADPIFHPLNDDPKYFFLGIGNEDTDEKTAQDIADWLKKFSNWKDLKRYMGEVAGDKTAPVWVFKNKTPKEIGELLDDFKAQHTIGKKDVFIFYYAGHMTILPADGDAAEGGEADSSLFKSKSKEVLRDDDLATKVQAIGVDDAAEETGTLRIVILDTCNAETFFTGAKDLKKVKNLALFHSTSAAEFSYTPKWHDHIVRTKSIAEIDKGRDPEPAGNDQVSWGEWAFWSIENTPGHEKGSFKDTFSDPVNADVYLRPVLKK